RAFDTENQFKAFVQAQDTDLRKKLNEFEAQLAGLPANSADRIEKQRQIDVAKRRLDEINRIQGTEFQDLLELRNNSLTFVERRFLTDFLQAHMNTAAQWDQTLRILGPDGVAELQKFIEGQVDPFIKLDDTANAAIDEIRNAPQFSIA